MSAVPTGFESPLGGPRFDDIPEDGQRVDLPQHVRLTAVDLMDRTDLNNEQAMARAWLLHSVQALRLRGNLFVAEETLGDRGWVFLKEAPLPHARAAQSAYDLQTKPRRSGHTVFLQDSDGYPWHVLEYTGGVLGRARAMQGLQRSKRPGLPVWFITNTWGDRSRDSRVTEAFVLQEIEAAAKLGADLVQIDDGWQKGRTVNSAEAAGIGGSGGVWEGFYASDPDFWTPHPQRFPNGLEPIVEAVQRHGLKLGLWFAPDSSNDFSQWEQDAETILALAERYGAEAFKLDSINVKNADGERNIRAMIQRVVEGSDGRIVLDLDVTAYTRPGYFGAMAGGPIFVENRYTDWHNYWPHHTLRNLWRLSHWIDPRRLRMEFLNNQRNAEHYAGDPLGPAAYDPAYLFATVMFSQPLGWFEASNLPADYAAQLPALTKVWREHREAIFDGTILPIGDEPDGTGWTGFLSVSVDGQTGYALVFRETNDQPEAMFTLPEDLKASAAEVLHTNGDADVSLAGSALRVSLAAARSYMFLRLY